MAALITPEELNVFRGIPLGKKIDSMTLYLIGDNSGYRYNMSEVGNAVFHDKNYSQTVSLIHRCYNFSGRNGGAYRPGCAFEKQYGYRVTRADVEAFLRQFPDGTFRSDMTFEQFLMSRLGGAQGGTAQIDPFQGGGQRKAAPQRGRTASRPAQKQNSLWTFGYTDRQSNNKERHPLWLVFVLGIIICIGYLVFSFSRGTVFRNWQTSLLCVLFIVGGFKLMKR